MSVHGFCVACLVALSASGAAAASEERASTAQANVHVLPPLYMPGLDRERRLRVYLPPGYETSRKH